MNKPRWQDVRDDLCQWPRCRCEGEIHYTQEATKWIDREDGVWLCEEHVNKMTKELFPEPLPGVKMGSLVWIAAMEDWPREQVYVRDWFLVGAKISLLVSDDMECELDDCQEIDLEMLEENTPKGKGLV